MGVVFVTEPDTEMDVFAKPQALVKINRRRRMNLWSLGEGSPTVVLVPGFMGVMADWRFVQPTLARTTRVVSYDHAGQGFSDPGPLPRSPARNAADLKALLAAAGIAPPYVLVGLSMGSFEARYFAHLYPTEVVGMVLVDPSFDHALKRMSVAAPSDRLWPQTHYDHFKRCEAAARAGELRPGTEAYETCIVNHARRDLMETIPAHHDLALRPSYWRSLASEYFTFIRDQADWPLGDLPLIVLSAGARDMRLPVPDVENEAIDRLWDQAHVEMARLSSRGVRRVVADAGHAITTDRPQAVIDAVLEVIAEARLRAAGGDPLAAT